MYMSRLLADCNILSQCNLLRAPCSTPCVSRGQLSLSGTQLRARAVLLTLCWDLAARTSNSSIPTLRPDCTPAREGENFLKTFYRNFLASSSTEQTALQILFKRRNWLRSTLPLQHWTCVRVHSAGHWADLLLFFLKKKKSQRRAQTPDYFTFCCYFYSLDTAGLFRSLLFRGPVFIA